MTTLKAFVFILMCIAYASNSFAEFKIISRSEWSAQIAQPLRLKNVDASDYDMVTLHFVADPSQTICGARAIQKYQKKIMDQHQTADVPFQFLIDKCGNIYQGQELSTLPFHSGNTLRKNQRDIPLNPNFKNIGIALLSHSSTHVSIAQQAASVWLIEQMNNQFEITSLLNIESLKRQLQLCQFDYVASVFNRSVISQEQKDAFHKISQFYSDVMNIDRTESFCSRTY